MAQQRGQYAKTAEVRRGIVNAALEVFGEKGYRATTMKEIALKAGISERGLVHHFPSKEELLLEVLGVHETESARLMPTEEGRKRLAGLLAVSRHNLERSTMLELQNQLSAEATSHDHPAHDRFISRYDDLRWVLADDFAQLAAQGSVAADIAPDRLATMYVALLDGLQLQWLYNNEAVDVEGTLRDFLRLVCPSETFTTTDDRTPIPAG